MVSVMPPSQLAMALGSPRIPAWAGRTAIHARAMQGPTLPNRSTVSAADK